MAIGVYTRYSRLGASSRLRTISAASGLPGAQLHHLWSDDALRYFYRTGRRDLGAMAAGWLRRFGRAFALEDKLLVEYELLPGFPAAWERFFLRRKSYILDFDDAVWSKSRQGKKFPRLISGAAGVVCANRKLAEYARQFNPRVALIPTPVECAKAPRNAEKYPEFTIAWIGTPVTWRTYMVPFLPVLEKLAETLDLTLLVISGQAPSRVGKLRIRYVPWSEETELAELSRAHVGIMPLGTDDFSQGKSAYKLIQYAACGLPAVASPVGENCVVLRDGETGFLAADPGAWCAALTRLAADPALRESLGAAARSAAACYDLGNFQAQYQDFCRTIWQ